MLFFRFLPTRWAVGLLIAGLIGCGTARDDGTVQTSNASTNATHTGGCRLPEQAPSPDASTADFSDFAWQQFVALNWPAGERRGRPDCDQPLGSDGLTVWQSYKTTSELFLDDASDPGPWESGSVGDFTLKHRAKAPASLPVESDIRQAVGGWLIDQHKNPTYYSISVDRASYDYVRTHQYYNADIVSQADSIAFPKGALEVKAAWRIMTPQDDQSRFHTMEAQVTEYDRQGNSTGKTRRATVGLVGLHIVYKAPGFPQWTWATFEQEDNTRPPADGHASYYDPDCKGDYCKPNQSPTDTKQPFDIPNQITRVTPVADEVAKVNATWQKSVRGTAFEHYRLISPQWPADPQNPGLPQGNPTPGTVANTTMESYIQPTSSCMDCHSTARVPGNKVKSDYSFIFLFAHSPDSDKTQGASQ